MIFFNDDSDQIMLQKHVQLRWTIYLGKKTNEREIKLHFKSNI